MSIFKNLTNRFANIGAGGNFFQSPMEFSDDAARQKASREGFQNFANSLGVVAAIQSGNPQRLALAQQNMMNFQERKKQQEDERIAEANQQNLITNALTIAKEAGATDEQLAIIGRDPAIARSVVQSSFDKPKDKTKSDFVVEILEKIRNIEGYKLTKTDQRILDTISDTDPYKIAIRDALSGVSESEPDLDNVDNSESEPVIVTTQEQFDKLPKGTRYIYNGSEYIKGQ